VHKESLAEPLGDATRNDGTLPVDTGRNVIYSPCVIFVETVRSQNPNLIGVSTQYRVPTAGRQDEESYEEISGRIINNIPNVEGSFWDHRPRTVGHREISPLARTVM
jgi:hypothetical protein